MKEQMTKSDSDFLKKLKWLMLSRVLFTTLLFGSTVILHASGSFPLEASLFALYWMIAGVLTLSFIYRVLLFSVKRKVLFAYVQIGFDTFFVTLIIFMTGSFASLFSFLYLVVIIYASMLLFRRGSMLMAALCSLQYGVMMEMEFYGIFEPYGINLVSIPLSGPHVLYKIMTMAVACFAVAFLSSLLSEQERKIKQDLWNMEEHVKRVEKMAAVGEMAAGLAHEVKNPLASLRGAIQMLKDEIPYNPDHDKLMRIVLREADRLSTLVGDFLLFARPPAGKTESIELGRALNEIVELFEKDRDCCGDIEIARDIASDVWVEMDSDHLRQIFWNLLLNSVDAIEGAGRIRLKMLPLRNRQIVVEISDNGCGMSEKVYKSALTPFFTTKSDGTGLGLSIVNRILEYYNSWLDIETEEGGGTNISLKLKRGEPPK